MKKLKSQAEIFGVALMFVVLLVGVIIYSQYKAINPNKKSEKLQDLQQLKYEKLSNNLLNSLLATSTNCYFERNDDSLKGLMKHCLINTYGGGTATLKCADGSLINTCDKSIEILSYLTNEVLNNSEFIQTPYVLKLEVPQNHNHFFHNQTITNFGSLNISGDIINETNYFEKGFTNKELSNYYPFGSAQGNVLISLEIYYR